MLGVGPTFFLEEVKKQFLKNVWGKNGTSVYVWLGPDDSRMGPLQNMEFAGNPVMEIVF